MLPTTDSCAFCLHFNAHNAFKLAKEDLALVAETDIALGLGQRQAEISRNLRHIAHNVVIGQRLRCAARY